VLGVVGSLPGSASQRSAALDGWRVALVPFSPAGRCRSVDPAGRQWPTVLAPTSRADRKGNLTPVWRRSRRKNAQDDSQPAKQPKIDGNVQDGASLHGLVLLGGALERGSKLQPRVFAQQFLGPVKITMAVVPP